VPEAVSRPLRPGAAQTLAVLIVDDHGRGVPGIRVGWTATNGTVNPAESISDETGSATTRFLAATAAGAARVEVAAVGLEPTAFEFDLRSESPAAFPLDLYLPVRVPTYEGSGQTVHPDYAAAPLALPDHLAITPYPGGRSDREQPSLFSGAGGLDWILPNGAPNPVVLQPPDGYLSDPDLVPDPETHKLRLYYRRAANGQNTILMVQSADGIRWTAPEVVLSVPNHEAISPAIVRRARGDWLMWTVNGGQIGCVSMTTTVERRTSADGIHWSGAETVDLSGGTLAPWHLDVQWIPSRSEFWAVFNGKSSGNCTTPALFLATSGDGIHWTTADRPVASRAVVPEFEDVVYRATFRFDPVTDDVWLWISGARLVRRGWVWSTMAVRRTRSSLFAPGQAAVRAALTPSVHSLTDWP
jgi:hypothetical protein